MISAAFYHFLQRAKSEGQDREFGWEIRTNDGSTFSGAIIEVLSDAVVITSRTSRATDISGNREDVPMKLCIPFHAIAQVRMSAEHEPSPAGQITS